MFFLNLFEAIGIGILSGFLAFSGALALQIERALGAVGFAEFPEVEQALEEAFPESKGEKIGDAVAKLPSRYELGGAIPRILIEHAGYQAAATAQALPAPITSASTTPEDIEEALANIFCTYRENELYTRATTGSGVFIDPRGVILTNAHVAQFLLLENNERDVRCVIRTGSPAKAQYVAELLYISPAWIHENADLIDDEHPSGTGERDYALLYVSEALEGELPDEFPALSVVTKPLTREAKHSTVYVAGYPAEILQSNGPRAKLTPVVATTTVTELYTFASRSADLIAIGPSAAGEQGSSGGPVLRSDGSIIGLIVTRGREDIDGKTSLRAITLPYIDATIEEETGFDLASTLAGDLPFRAQTFREALVPFLSSLLSSELN